MAPAGWAGCCQFAVWCWLWGLQRLPWAGQQGRGVRTSAHTSLPAAPAGCVVSTAWAPCPPSCPTDWRPMPAQVAGLGHMRPVPGQVWVLGEAGCAGCADGTPRGKLGAPCSGHCGSWGSDTHIPKETLSPERRCPRRPCPPRPVLSSHPRAQHCPPASDAPSEGPIAGEGGLGPRWLLP